MPQEKTSTRLRRRWPGFAGPLNLFHFALITTAALSLASCKSQATAACQPTVPPPVAVPTLIPVAVDGDSAVLEARFRADQGGAVLMEVLRQETSKRMTLQARLDSTGNLKVKAQRQPDTVYARGSDSLIYVPVSGPEKTVEVNVLTWRQKAMIWIGTATLLLLAVLGLPRLLKAIVTLLKHN